MPKTGTSNLCKKSVASLCTCIDTHSIYALYVPLLALLQILSVIIIIIIIIIIVSCRFHLPQDGKQSRVVSTHSTGENYPNPIKTLPIFNELRIENRKFVEKH